MPHVRGCAVLRHRPSRSTSNKVAENLQAVDGVRTQEYDELNRKAGDPRMVVQALYGTSVSLRPSIGEVWTDRETW